MVISIYEEPKKLIREFLTKAGVRHSLSVLRLYGRELRGEELIELFTAYKNDDKVEMLDGVADADFINFSHLHLSGDRAEFNKWHALVSSFCESVGITKRERVEALTEVAKSNLTKFDTSEEGMKETEAHYRLEHHLFVETSHEGDLFMSKVNGDQQTEGVVYPHGKLLKSVSNYKPPRLLELATKVNWTT